MDLHNPQASHSLAQPSDNVSMYRNVGVVYQNRLTRTLCHIVHSHLLYPKLEGFRRDRRLPLDKVEGFHGTVGPDFQGLRIGNTVVLLLLIYARSTRACAAERTYGVVK